MDATELAKSIQLHPRAVVVLGTIEPRSKNAGTLSGFTPHYTTKGCPVVEFSGANALPREDAAEIEFLIQEKEFPFPTAIADRRGARSTNLVQLVAGASGKAPSQSAYRVLLEAGQIFKQIADGRRDVFLVSMPTYWPAQYGSSQGRHYLLGAFTTDGTALFLHPEAVGQVLQAEFPAHQKERSFADAAPAPQVQQTQEDWYRGFERALQTSLKGRQLHEAILRARAQQLMDRGVAPDLRSGVAIAREDARAYKAGPQAATKAQSAGKGLLESFSKSLPKGSATRSR